MIVTLFKECFIIIWEISNVEIMIHMIHVGMKNGNRMIFDTQFSQNVECDGTMV